MMRFRKWLLLGWLVFLGSAFAGQAGLFLEGTRGPYRGRVIDAETKKPLAGAVVAAVWRQRSGGGPVHAAREVLTDAHGEFLMAVEDIERNAPSDTLRPSFFIFVQGYGAYPGYQVQPPPHRYIEGPFEGAGRTVELPPLKTSMGRGMHIVNISSDGSYERLLRDLGGGMQTVKGNELLKDEWVQRHWGKTETLLPNLTRAIKSEWRYGLELLRWMKEADETMGKRKGMGGRP